MTVLVFSHANSFPAGVYRVLFEAWRAAGFEVQALPRFGHDPRFPVTNNWPHLRDQLLEFIAAHVEEPAYLVGHSLGGMVSLLAASRRPQIARASFHQSETQTVPGEQTDTTAPCASR